MRVLYLYASFSTSLNSSILQPFSAYTLSEMTSKFLEMIYNFVPQSVTQSKIVVADVVVVFFFFVVTVYDSAQPCSFLTRKELLI